MQQKKQIKCLLLFLILISGFRAAAAQNGDLKISYTVSLQNPASQQFRVTTEISDINQPRIDLSLPTWTPGWYTIENYAKNLLRFRVTDNTGKILPHTMSRKQTWNVDTRGIRQIRIEYDYQATVLALNQAKIAKDFAFFTGVELFLQPEGHRDDPSKVRFIIPTGWKIISALKETADPMTFTASNYDTLVDAPTEMGNFDVRKFEVEGKPFYFVATPAGTFNTEKSARFIEMLAKVAKAHSTTFGGLPFDKYVSFYFFAPPESNASGALEHLNSFVAFAPPGEQARPEQIIGTASHEFFHLWNVKRIRPAEMWPYDYSRENETPLLWVSEGFTNYYGVVGVYRAGLMTPEEFVGRAADAAAGVENTPARAYISPAEASVSTWVGYDSPTAFGISYYTQGQNLAALLDLSIRNDTDGTSGLDDVMRALYADFYKSGRGFTTADMIGVINNLTKKDYNDFFNRYVFWTDVPDYDRIFGYAGYRLERKTQQSPILGFSVRFRNGGLYVSSVEPNSGASAAGLRQGDVVTKIDGTDPRQVQFQTLAGKTAVLSLNRGGAEMTVQVKIGARPSTDFNLAPMPEATAKQLKIRQAWLKR